MSLEWQCGLLTLNIIPILFKNYVMKKTKIGSGKNIWTAATVFSQSDTYMSAPDENSREVNIYLKSQALNFAKICSLQISSRNWSPVYGNLVKSLEFYRFFLNINVMPFYFHFLQRMLSHPFCYLKCALFKATKSWIFKIVSLRRTLNVIPWNFFEFRNQVHYRKSLRE